VVSREKKTRKGGGKPAPTKRGEPAGNRPHSKTAEMPLQRAALQESAREFCDAGKADEFSSTGSWEMESEKFGFPPALRRTCCAREVHVLRMLECHVFSVGNRAMSAVACENFLNGQSVSSKNLYLLRAAGVRLRVATAPVQLAVLDFHERSL